MKKANKCMAVLLVLGMLATGFVGCSGKTTEPLPAETPATSPANTPDPSATTASGTIDPYGPVSDEVTVVHIGREESTNVNYAAGEDSLTNYVTKHLSETLNVEYIYDFSVDPSTYNTKVSMAIASGDMPDVMVVEYLQMRQLVEAGAVEDMTDIYNTYASEGLKNAFASANGISHDLVTFNERMMAIPNLFPGMDGIPLLFVRGDWMEEVGITEAPKTIEDITEIVKAFKEKNPGGNVNTGLAVSQDIVQENGGMYHINSLFGLYDSYPKFWEEQADGSVVYGSTTPKAKEALGEIRKLVEEGVIDGSFAVRDGTQCREIVFSGQSGAFFGAWWTGQAVVDMLAVEDDSVKWNIYPAPLNAQGKLNTMMKSPTSGYVVVKKGSSEEIKQAIMKTVNIQYDLDQEQALSIRENGLETPFSWHYFPINTLHCDYDAKERQIQGVMDVIDGKMAYEDQTGDGKTWYDGYTTVLEKGFRQAVDTNISTANGWGWSTGAWVVQSNSDIITRHYAGTYAKSPTMESKWATLETMEDEIFLQILTGDVELDAFDDFVAQWKALGGDTITQEMSEIAQAN